MTTLTPDSIARVAHLLGREPRGLEDIVVAATDGTPRVIRVASLVDGKPFPTMFWLVDPDAGYRIDREEAAGLIKQFQLRVDQDPDLLAALAEDHRRHIALRNSHLSGADRARLQELGYYEVLQRRGIGGIADFSRIRCLHTWYAAHLVQANTIGAMLDAHWEQN